MQVQLSPQYRDDEDAKQAAAIMRKCVHCGFCNATCPTYQLLGDELDGPRGRIYLVKQMLEGAAVTRSTQQHLDRCLTCLSCQTTCPSGVEYGHLVEIGRTMIERKVRRPLLQQAARWFLKEGLTSRFFASALRLGRLLRPILPRTLRDKMPARRGNGATNAGATNAGATNAGATNAGATNAGATNASDQANARWPAKPRQVLMLQGCVQPAMLPDIDRAAVRVLEAAGIETVHAGGAGCCGALRTHLSDSAGGLADMRRNIDAWSPLLASGGIEAIVSSASACALQIKEYGHALARDAAYAARAGQVSALARDLSELLPQLVPVLKQRLRGAPADRLSFHSPCTLQHGQKLRGGIETQLRELGFNVAAPCNESHFCCGSAGTYSVLQPQLARQLRDRKLENLAKQQPDAILSANVGCIQHLQSGTSTRVIHWIEAIERALN
jgi:glycolate oxidase iron-sulfur subunit